VLSGLAVASQAHALDLKEIVARGSLRVLVASDEQPEMFAIIPGAAPGFEREIIEGFSKTRRLKLEIVTVANFEQIIPMLNKGEGDLIMGIVETDSRRKQIDFTIETLPARHLVVSRAPQPPVTSLDEFRKAKVGVVAATSWAEAAAAAGAKTPASFADLPQVLEALQTGKIGATVMSTPDFALAQRKDPSLRAGIFIGPPSHAAWGARKGDKALVDALNDYIFNMRSTPAWGQLVGRYFSNDALELFKRARRADGAQ
jgi:ABC-type amino acid transport substrate-binding protein